MFFYNLVLIFISCGITWSKQLVINFLLVEVMYDASSSCHACHGSYQRDIDDDFS
jgi:hypothetical protein